MELCVRRGNRWRTRPACRMIRDGLLPMTTPTTSLPKPKGLDLYLLAVDRIIAMGFVLFAVIIRPRGYRYRAEPIRNEFWLVGIACGLLWMIGGEFVRRRWPGRTLVHA